MDIEKAAGEWAERYFHGKGDPYESLSDVFKIALLAAQDDMAERCAKICEQNLWMSARVIAQEVRALKSNPEGKS